MDFVALKNLISILNRNKIKNIEILGQGSKKRSMTEELYEAILDGHLENEEAAADHFYPNDPTGGAKFRKLKWRLVRQLTNLVFFVDNKESKFSERLNAQDNAYRNFAAAQIMVVKGAVKASSAIMQEVLEQSIQYEFTELAAMAAQNLRRQYARILDDKEYLTRYTMLHQKYEKKRQLEFKAFDYNEELIAAYNAKNISNKTISDRAAIYHEELSAIAAEADSAQFYFHTYNIGLIRYMLDHDYRTALTLCEEALNLFEERPNINRGSLLAIALQKLSSLTQLRLFQETEKDNFLDFCLNLNEEGSFNWFKVLDMYVYYYFYTKRYEEALKIFNTAISHPQYKLLKGVNAEIWQLHAGYLHLLAKLKQLSPKAVEEKAGPFDYVRFINQFSAITSDKEGMNIPLMMFPVLYNLAEGNLFEYGRSLEALDKYRQRYLNNEANRRSAYFMKALVALSKVEFEREASERKIRYELTELRKIPPEDAARFFIVEIVPYEDLWELLIR